MEETTATGAATAGAYGAPDTRSSPAALPPPSGIRLESVQGASDRLDVVITSPHMQRPAQSKPALLPTLWNVSYAFRMYQNKTAVHRVSFKQKSSATIHAAIRTFDKPLPLLSRADTAIASNSSAAVDAFVEAIRTATTDVQRPLCSSEWDCPAALDSGVACRLAVEGPVTGATVSEAASHHDMSYRIVSYFATGTPPAAAAGHDDQTSLPPQEWRFRYSATLRYGAVVLLNDRVVASFPARRWHTGPMTVFEDRFHVLHGWNKLEIFGADACCNKGGHSLQFSRRETPDGPWSSWKPWGPGKGGLPAVSGFMPPVKGPRWDVPTKEFRIAYEGETSENMPVNILASDLREKIAALHTVGMVEVSPYRHDHQPSCQNTGWCTWDVTFMTNVLFNRKISEQKVSTHMPVSGNDDGTMTNLDGSLLPCDADLTVENIGQVKMAQFVKDDDVALGGETVAHQNMYDADITIRGTELGGRYPGGRMKLEGIAGAAEVPFYVAARARTKAGWSPKVEITCSPPDRPRLARSDVKSANLIVVTVPRPKNDNGARITKVLLKWASSGRLLHQVQNIAVRPAVEWNIVHHAVVGGDETLQLPLIAGWNPPLLRRTQCGYILQGYHQPLLGGYANYGAGTKITRTVTDIVNIVEKNMALGQALDENAYDLRISFDFVFIDDWRGEEAILSVNGHTLWRHRHASKLDRSTAIMMDSRRLAAQNFHCGLSEFSDAAVGVVATRPLPAKGDNIVIDITTTLPVDGDAVRGADAASWGISNFRLQLVPKTIVRESSIHFGDSGGGGGGRRAAGDGGSDTKVGNPAFEFSPATTVQPKMLTTFARWDKWAMPKDKFVASCGAGLDCGSTATTPDSGNSAENVNSLRVPVEFWPDAAVGRPITWWVRNSSHSWNFVAAQGANPSCTASTNYGTVVLEDDPCDKMKVYSYENGKIVTMSLAVDLGDHMNVVSARLLSQTGASQEDFSLKVHTASFPQDIVGSGGFTTPNAPEDFSWDDMEGNHCYLSAMPRGNEKKEGFAKSGDIFLLWK